MPTAAFPPTDAIETITNSPVCNDSDDDLGDFVDSDYECDIEGVAEDPNLYPSGLCYPICIGEILVGRYRIDHKLGHGSFSTVWMAHDMTEKTDVALKIMMLGQSVERECHIRDKIVSAVPDTGTTHLLLHKGRFLLQSPHGHHQVLVFPLQGPNLRDYSRKVPVATRMSFAVQLLQALKCLHGCGIVHGDLNSANIMYSLRPLGDCSISMKYECLGRPQKMRLFTEQWKAGELVMPMQPRETLVGDTILLGDLGLAHEPGTSGVQKLQMPTCYCAPERVHGADPSFGSDMWSYMCLFFELYAKVRLFPGSGYASAVSCIVNTVGPLPESWKGSYCAGGLYDDAWYDQNRCLESAGTLEEKTVHFRTDIGPRELEYVMSILRRGQSYLPEHRLTAAQLLEDDSFKALMEMYGL